MAFNREKALAAAAKFAAKGQHDRAAKEYAAVVEADPSDIRSWLLLADALKLMGDAKGAIERFMHVGKHYTDAGEHQKALAVYRQVLQLDSNRLDVQGKVAGLYKELGRIQDAISTYEFVAQAYFQAGQIPDGLEGFRMVAELDPGAVGKRLRLAELYSREGMVPQAVEHFRLAAEKLFNDRRIDDYIRVAERLIYHKEDDLPVLRQLARIYLSQNENRRALVKLNALLRSAPADPEGLELLADTFIALGKQDKAASVLQELAREQRKGGRKAKMLAARVLKKAIGLAPENVEDLKKIAADIDAEIAALPVDPKERDADLDLDVDVVEEEAAAGTATDLELDVEVEDVPSRPFAGVSDNVAPGKAEEPEDDNVGDVDKLLLEVRVYIKYKMFEHALGHLDSVFVRDASHVPALELQAQILETLQRGPEAADTYVRLAQLVAGRDPKLAREHVEKAQALAPNHTRAEMVLAALDAQGGLASDQADPLVRGLGSGASPMPPPADSQTGLPRIADVAGDMSQDSGARTEPAANEEPSQPGVAQAESQPGAAQAEPAQAESEAVRSEPEAAKTELEPQPEPKKPVKLDLREAMQAASDREKAEAEAERLAAEAAQAEAKAEEVAPAQAAEVRAAEDEAKAEVAEAKTEAAAAEQPAKPEAEAKPTPREDSGLKNLALGLPTLPKIGEGGEKVESALGKTPLPGPLPIRFGEKTPAPLHRLPGEKTPLPVFRPPTGIKKPETDESSAAPELPKAEGSEGARKLPSEGSQGTRKLPSEGSEGGRKSPGEGSQGARKLPSEGSEGARELPKAEASEGARKLPSRAEEPEARPQPERKPPRKGPPAAFKPPPKPAATEEVEEIEAEEFEEIEAVEVVDDERPAPPKKKAPPTPARPPAKRPPARPAGKVETKPKAAPVSSDSAEAKPAEAVAAESAETGPDTVAAEIVETRPVAEVETTREPTVSADSSGATSAVEATVSADSSGATPAAETPVSESEPEKPAEIVEAQPAPADSSAEPTRAAGPAEVAATDATVEPAAEAASEPAVPADSDVAAAEPAAAAPVPPDSESTETPIAAAEPAVSPGSPAAEPAVSADSQRDAGGRAAAEPAVSADSQPDDAGGRAAAEPAVSADSLPVEAPVAADSPSAADAPVPADSEPAERAADASVSADSELAAEPSARAPEAPAGGAAAEEISGGSDATPAGETPAASDEAALETRSAVADLADSTAAASAGEPAAQWPDITDELEELRFFIASKFEDDAQFTYLELQRRFPGHPALAEFAARFSTGAKLDSAAAPVMIEDVPAPAPTAPGKPPAPEVAARVERLEDEEDDDFLSAIFDEPVAPAPAKKNTGPQRAIASLDNETDAQTLFDLGMAYHEMGLIDDALTQFGLAARDRTWTSRAHVMIADLRLLRGERDPAIVALGEAIATANDDDQRDAARYRLVELLLAVGDNAAAVEALRQISPGYRDRDALLAEHGG